MDFRKIALFCDLDGTLFNTQSTVPVNNITAVSRFVQDGGVFCISTGRSQDNSSLYLTEVEINGPSILYNGSALYSFAKKRFLSQHFLPFPQTKVFLDFVLREYPRINVQVYPPDHIYFVSSRETADVTFMELHQPFSFIYLDQAPTTWLKVLLMGDSKQLEEISIIGQSLMNGAADFVFSSPIYLELLPQNINKGSALLEAAVLPEVRDRTTIAIGDFYNDLELLKMADIAIAPENAVSPVKELAQYVVYNNNEGAVADLINRILPVL